MNIVNYPVSNMTSGRPYGITGIVIHHMAGRMTASACAQTLQNRGVSAHYGIGIDGVVGKYVDENNRAWHAGDGVGVNSRGNDRAIAIETSNSAGAPGYPVDEATFNLLVELVNDIATRRNLKPLRVGDNLFGHKDVKATACPGVLYNRLQELADRVNGYNNAPSSAPAPAPQPAQNNEQRILSLAQAVLRGEYGDGDQRKARLGADYLAVQAKVNQLLGASAPAQLMVNMTAIADAVIRGEYGNGPERRNRLGNLYSAVQAIVNRKLGF